MRSKIWKLVILVAFVAMLAIASYFLYTNYVTKSPYLNGKEPAQRQDTSRLETGPE